MRRVAAVAFVVACGAWVSGCVVPRRRDQGAEPARGEPASSPEGREPEQQPGVHRVDPRYAPIEAIVERAPLPGLSRTAATTIGTKVYVADLDDWLARHPPGSPPYEAVLLHEQVHAQRQVAAGVDPWIQRYLSDRAFMWAEEQRGWYVQLRHLRQRGLGVDAAAVARNLTTYRNLAGAMVSYDEALEWTRAVLEGRWAPPP